VIVMRNVGSYMVLHKFYTEICAYHNSIGKGFEEGGEISME
jgi:hypothetical protein